MNLIYYVIQGSEYLIVGASLPGLVGHYSTVYSVSFSSRDTVLYSGGRDRFILQWDPPLRISAAQASKVSRQIFSSQLFFFKFKLYCE